MKKTLPFLLLPFTVLLCGCPYDSPYNLDETPQQDIDSTLLGKWCALPASQGLRNPASADSVRVFFSKRTNQDYDVTITGGIHELKRYHVVTNDSIKGTAYLSTVGNKQFLNTYIHGKVYIAEVVRDSASVSILPLAEYFTSKLIKNCRELRSAVEFHYKVAPSPGYDQLFSLRHLQRAE